MDNSQRQYSRVCFTSFEEFPPPYDEAFMSFYICLQETCPETGKLHWQGYLELRTKRVISKLKKMLGDSVHIELARGTAMHNIKYCTKSTTDIALIDFSTHGQPSAQGTRTDLAYFHERLLAGENLDDLVMLYSEAARFYRALLVIQAAIYRQLSTKLRSLEVIYVWGPSGTGKSRFAWESGDTYRPTISTAGQFWFDHYSGEKTLWLDDLDWTTSNMMTLLHLLDIYPLPIQVKSSTTYALWTKVIITSNFPPPPVGQPLRRRITEVKEYINT